MGHPRGFVLPGLALTLTTFVAGCSSSPERTSQGSLAVALGASRLAAGVQAAAPSPDDPLARLKAASITIADVEARRADGSWVPIDGGLPAVVDLLDLANGGRTVALPSDLLPEGQHNALQLRITQVELTRLDGTRTTIAPRGTGWVVLIPVDFGVVTGRATIVELIVGLDSLKSVNGDFEFEPEFEVEGVEHD